MEDIDPKVLDKEREIEMQKEDLQSKPEAIRSKMVDGRIQKLAKVGLTLVAAAWICILAVSGQSQKIMLGSTGPAVPLQESI